jgi:hypothetical protein
MARSTQQQAIIDRHKQIAEALDGCGALKMEQNAATDLETEEEYLLMEYMELLDHIPVSRCPICGADLKVTIDLAGFDGPWWWTTCPVDLPTHKSCQHFQVFLGAVHLRGTEPEESSESVMVGPAIPFVVTRLLEHPTAKAVLSALKTHEGHTVFIIAYYAEKPFPQAESHQEFRHESYALLDDQGEIEFAEHKHDRWDFDLDPWLQTKQLTWIAPEDTSLRLRGGLESPYKGLDGTKMNQVLEYGEVDLYEAPHDQKDTKFERH